MAWETWSVHPVITDILKGLSMPVTSVTDECMDELERFVVLFYNRGSGNSRVNAE